MKKHKTNNIDETKQNAIETNRLEGVTGGISTRRYDSTHAFKPKEDATGNDHKVKPLPTKDY